MGGGISLFCRNKSLIKVLNTHSIYLSNKILEKKKETSKKKNKKSNRYISLKSNRKSIQYSRKEKKIY